MQYKSITYSISKKNLKEIFYIVLKKKLLSTAIFDCIWVLYLWGCFLFLKTAMIGKYLTVLFIITVIAYKIDIFVEVKGSILRNPYLLEEVNLEFDENDVVLTQKNLIMKRKWSDFKYVIFGKKYMYFVEKTKNTFTFIPNSLFSSENQISLIKDSISKKIRIKRR
ncbi:YcxB family protein [Paramaledivibacter caminithermalis]|uniref:YcxB-like protein n=1 Tax=Paramaledivibacter caminithermalis (strain DSM 15212 / CIP 107654 / DViRD3) TaxID=1121301 RepID=A0A1M6LMR9_PARC5|nr:YcxB family protein [Paramaledivibacter caminithermalis]SHJ72467.1 YcxB-like protein [Paramaledivibacter caminithermalis DSM 15212]